MKRMVVVLIMAAVAVAVAAAQRGGVRRPSSASATTEDLIRLENEWVGALTKADTAALDSIFVDSYVDTDETGHRSDKQGVLAVLKSGDLKLGSIKLSDMRVYDYGDAAIVTGSAEQAGSFKGQAMAGRVIFTDTFVRRNGKWRAVASHRSAI